MIEKTLVKNKIAADTDAEALKILANLLYQQGKVKESFLHAVLQREKDYPTGLPMAGMAVALPHTDPQYVNQATLAVGKLEKPVAFRQMGDPDETVLVELIVMMCINDSTQQLPMLRGLLSVFSDETVTERLRQCSSDEDLYAVFSEVIHEKLPK